MRFSLLDERTPYPVLFVHEDVRRLRGIQQVVELPERLLDANDGEADVVERANTRVAACERHAWMVPHFTGGRCAWA